MFRKYNTINDFSKYFSDENKNKPSCIRPRHSSFLSFFSTSRVSPIMGAFSSESETPSLETPYNISILHSLSAPPLPNPLDNPLTAEISPPFHVYITHHYPLTFPIKVIINNIKKTPHMLVVFHENNYEIIKIVPDINEMESHQLNDYLNNLISLDKLNEIISKVKPTNAKILLCPDANLGVVGGDEVTPQYLELVTTVNPDYLFPMTAQDKCLEKAKIYIKSAKLQKLILNGEADFTKNISKTIASVLSESNPLLSDEIIPQSTNIQP